MLHPVLEKLIKEEVSLQPEMREPYSALCEKISNYFFSYERDIKMLEHASNIANEDYEKINARLVNLNKELKVIAKQSTQERDIMAQFPFENPNPVFRIDAEGNIQYMNPSAASLKEIEYNQKKYKPEVFFLAIRKRLTDSGQIEFKWDGKFFLFNYKKTVQGDKLNFYGTDITALTELQQKSYENFYRLSNFLESTEAVHFIVYKNKKENNFFTSRWPTFFGFNPSKVENAFEEKKICILPASIPTFEKAMEELEINKSVKFKYQIKNLTTKRKLWIEEELKKKYDPYLDDEVITGKIEDITQNELYKAAMEETENRFKNITESMPVMLWVSDHNNKVIYSNEGTKQFFGKGLEEIDVKEFESLMHPEYSRANERIWYDKVKNNMPVEQEFLIKNKSGNYRFLKETAMPRVLPTGEFIGYIGAFFDFTKEYEYNLQLENDKKQFELISLNSNDVVVMTDWEGVIQYISPSVKRILDYSENEILYTGLYELMCNDCKVMLPPMIHQGMFVKEKFVTQSFRMVRKDRKEVWVDAVITPIEKNTDEKLKLIWHIRDVNEQYLSVEALKRSEEQYRMIFQNMALGILQVDANEKIIFVNRAMETITGYASAEMIGKTAPELFLPKPEQKAQLNEILKKRKKGEANVYELTMTNKNGEDILIVVSGVPQFNEEGKFMGSTGINWDVTEIRRIQQSLQEERINKEKEVFEATMQAEEEQRAHIGRDLHDGVGQMLAYMTLYINMIKAKGIYSLHEMGELEKSVKHTLEQVRTLSRTLTPPAIRDLGLRDAVIELVNSYGILEKPVFQLKVYPQDQDDQVQMDKKHVIYRVIQELLNNAFKYADADKIYLELKIEQQQFIMLYQDDGKGFDTKKIKKGVGLDSMRSRIKFHKGFITISTAPGKGVKINIQMPLNHIETNNLLINTQTIAK
jgi:PAS domain S-box-containing protein